MNDDKMERFLGHSVGYSQAWRVSAYRLSLFITDRCCFHAEDRLWQSGNTRINQARFSTARLFKSLPADRRLTGNARIHRVQKTFHFVIVRIFAKN